MIHLATEQVPERSDRIDAMWKKERERVSAESIHTAFTGHRPYATRRNPYPPGSKKMSRAAGPARKIVSTLCNPASSDLIFFGGLTLLLRARAPPETWTTRLRQMRQPEPQVVDDLFTLVILFGNDCSKFAQFAK
jgi:hypothetical protein